MAKVEGKLRLRFEYRPDSQATVMQLEIQQSPLKVVRAFPQSDGAALVHLHNLSGGVLGGDCLEIALELKPQARAVVTSTSATRLYRSRSENLTARQYTCIKVGAGSLLEYLPDQLIPFAGSRYCQQTRIELDEGAGLFWWETVAPGREAHGELFEYALLETRLAIMAGAKPIALEHLRLEPALRPLTSAARLGPYRYFTTFYICRVGLAAPKWRELETQLGELVQSLTRPDESLWGVSTLTAHGLVIRAVSRSGRDLAPGLTACWQAAKQTLYAQAAVLPRKIY